MAVPVTSVTGTFASAGLAQSDALPPPENEFCKFFFVTLEPRKRSRLDCASSLASTGRRAFDFFGRAPEEEAGVVI